MKIEAYSFGCIQINGKEYGHDVVIDRGKVGKRDKKPSKALNKPGHTPLSAREEIPWKCRRLIIGTGAYGSLPVLDDLKREAAERHVELVLAPTPQAIDNVNNGDPETNAILHVTC